MPKNKLVPKEIARQIRAWRNEQGWTQSAFARRTRMKQTSLSRCESGEHMPSVTTLCKIANGFGAELSVRFLSREKSPLRADLVEWIAATIYDAHPAHKYHARWADLLHMVKRPTKATKGSTEHYIAILEARREEARAVLHELSNSA